MCIPRSGKRGNEQCIALLTDCSSVAIGVLGSCTDSQLSSPDEACFACWPATEQFSQASDILPVESVQLRSASLPPSI